MNSVGAGRQGRQNSGSPRNRVNLITTCSRCDGAGGETASDSCVGSTTEGNGASSHASCDSQGVSTWYRRKRVIQQGCGLELPVPPVMVESVTTADNHQCHRGVELR